MIGHALDSNNDLIIEKGALKLVEDGAEVVQHVRTRLLFYLEEWFLDLQAGTPWFQEVFLKPANLANIESLLKQRILETPGVQSPLIEFSVDYQGGSSRLLTVDFSAQTTFGSIIKDNVTINS